MVRDCQIKVTISRCLFIGIMKVGSCCHGDIHIHTKVMGALTLEGVSLIRIQFMRGTKISRNTMESIVFEVTVDCCDKGKGGDK